MSYEDLKSLEEYKLVNNPSFCKFTGWSKKENVTIILEIASSSFLREIASAIGEHVSDSSRETVVKILKRYLDERNPSEPEAMSYLLRLCCTLM